MKPRHLPTAFGILALSTLISCSVNPATGERQLILISESREIEMGREADVSITEQMGLYDDSAVAAYVEQVGLRLQSVAERSNLPWTFKLVDDPVVNAFALPGGFIYVTRGILAYLNNEAQLAAVMGHEIGHVTARHGAEQMSRSQIAQVGLGVGSVLSPTAAQISGLAGSGLGLLFLSYGRSDERQADALGFRYMTNAGYDARQMPDVFKMLGSVTAAAGGSGTPSWLSTHPDPGDRYERITQAITDGGTDYTGRDVDATGYLDVIDGLTFGEDPREGYFDGPRFMQPDLEFEITFPADWTTQNQRQGVVGISPDERAIIQLTVANAGTPAAAARSLLSGRGVEGSSSNTEVNGLDAARANFSATATDGTTIAGIALFVAYNDAVYSVIGYGAGSSWSKQIEAVRATLNSFARLTDPEALAVQPRRVSIVTIPRTMSLAEYLEANPAAVDADKIALINQIRLSDVLRSGTRIKTVLQ